MEILTFYAKLISIAFNSSGKEEFLEDVQYFINLSLPCDEVEADRTLLGYDILGWDNLSTSFHSYLCNGFEKNVSEKYSILINEYGLLQNPYTQVKEFSNYIDDKEGEPVLWFPFALHEYSVDKDG